MSSSRIASHRSRLASCAVTVATAAAANKFNSFDEVIVNFYPFLRLPPASVSIFRGARVQGAAAAAMKMRPRRTGPERVREGGASARLGLASVYFAFMSCLVIS